jgi:hypothetical protein
MCDENIRNSKYLSKIYLNDIPQASILRVLECKGKVLVCEVIYHEYLKVGVKYKIGYYVDEYRLVSS